MKTTLLLILLLVCTSCTTRNQYGKCIGLANRDEKDAITKYEVSYWNVFLGVVFWETMLVPVVVGGWELECPTK